METKGKPVWEALLQVRPTLDRPLRESPEYSLMDRRAVQIANLRFSLEHAEELGIGRRKLRRMETALEAQEHAQIRYGNRNGKHF